MNNSFANCDFAFQKLATFRTIPWFCDLVFSSAESSAAWCLRSHAVCHTRLLLIGFLKLFLSDERVIKCVIEVYHHIMEDIDQMYSWLSLRWCMCQYWLKRLCRSLLLELFGNVQQRRLSMLNLRLALITGWTTSLFTHLRVQANICLIAGWHWLGDGNLSATSAEMERIWVSGLSRIPIGA